MDHYSNELTAKHGMNLYKASKICSVTLKAEEFDRANPFRSCYWIEMFVDLKQIGNWLLIFAALLNLQLHFRIVTRKAREVCKFH